MPGTADLSSQETKIAIYAAYGRAMLAAHSLELRLAALLITRLVGDNLPIQQVQTAQAKIEKLTMGQLIKRFLQEFKPSEDIKEELNHMLHLRNELAHRIAKLILHSAQAPNWEAQLNAELAELTTYFGETREALQPYINDWINKHGVSNAELLNRGLTLYPGFEKYADKA